MIFEIVKRGRQVQLDDHLFRQLEPDLRQIAAGRLKREGNCSLAIDDLVNEAMLRILNHQQDSLVGRAHILAWVSRVMRHILIDHARRKNTAKRFHRKVTLVTAIPEAKMVDLIELDQIIGDLETLDPERAKIVEMRFFGGMSMAEIAEVTGLSVATVKRRWSATRLWLQGELVR